MCNAASSEEILGSLTPTQNTVLTETLKHPPTLDIIYLPFISTLYQAALMEHVQCG